MIILLYSRSFSRGISGKTGNPIAKFVAGLGNGVIEVAGAAGQFSVYDMGKTAYSLTNP